MNAPAPARAVFLSYAREDAEAARRIADALRAFGVEVWFDQNELRGGDSWDQKIRKQIRDCALFLPVISNTTQERGEGYFRREWKLGVERTHDMASGVAFIVPVVIDDVPAGEAAVPEEFLRCQWTHLPRGIPRPEFVVQVQGLLNAPRKGSGGGAPAASAAPAEARTQPKGKRRHPSAGLLVGAVGAAVLALAVYVGFRFISRAPVAESVAPTGPAIPAIDEHSVAVLPFENLSADKDNDAFFADGIHEDILTKLSLVRALRVVSRTSVMQYRATTKAIPQIARELGVAYILEGSVRRAGSKVRVTGQLIRAGNDEHVWAQAYDRDITDIFAIQGEVAQAIADALKTELSPREKSLIENRPTQNAEAYDLFLRARAMSDGASPVLHQEALLKAALQLDPNFALAWARLAYVDSFAVFKEEDATPERIASAKQAIEQAVSLAPDDPGVLDYEGDYYYYAYRDYDRARALYDRLALLKPNEAGLKRALALIDRREGRLHAAIQGLRTAHRLDPADRSAEVALAECLCGVRAFDEAESVFQDAIVRYPHDAIIAGLDAWNRFCRDGSTAAFEQYQHSMAYGASSDIFLYGRKAAANFAGDWPAAVRLNREHPFLEVGGETHWSQMVESAVTLDDAGEHDEARRAAREAVTELNREIGRQTHSSSIWYSRAIAASLLGQWESALADADTACRMLPESKDALQGPVVSMARASVWARAGRADRAIDELARELRIPFGPNVHWLARGNAMPISFRSLAGNPRFEALLRDPANNAPLP